MTLSLTESSEVVSTAKVSNSQRLSLFGQYLNEASCSNSWMSEWLLLNYWLASITIYSTFMYVMIRFSETKEIIIVILLALYYILIFTIVITRLLI